MSQSSARGLRRELLRRTGRPSPVEMFVWVGPEDECPFCAPGTIHEVTLGPDDTLVINVDPDDTLVINVDEAPVRPGASSCDPNLWCQERSDVENT